MLKLMKDEGVDTEKIKDYGVQFKNTYDMVAENLREFRGAKGYSSRRAYRTMKMGGPAKVFYCTFSPLKDGDEKLVDKGGKELCICT